VLIELVLLLRLCLVLGVLRRIAFVVFLLNCPVVASVCGLGNPVMEIMLLLSVCILCLFADIFCVVLMVE